ncbi:unnamed protein product [Brassica rapa subsp. trilocularis]
MDFTPEETILQSIISARKWISAQDTLKAGLRWIFYNQTGQIRKGSEVHEYVSSSQKCLHAKRCFATPYQAISRILGSSVLSRTSRVSQICSTLSPFFSLDQKTLKPIV